MTRDYVTINKDVWNADAENWVQGGERLWGSEPMWGIWGLPEDDLNLLPQDMASMTAIELGCGTGYVAGWMAKRGAQVTAIDVSDRQLATARRLSEEHGTDITFIEGNAETTGLPDAAFDFAISEYGAAIWCPPDVWLREAHRLLRPGGRLVFLGNHPLAIICSPESGAPAEARLHRPYKDLWGADWTKVEIDPSGICFVLSFADWLALFREIGFEVENYQELYAPKTQTEMRAFIPAEWAQKYPCEQVWHLRKPS